MSRFPELHRSQFEEFLQTFSRPGTLKLRNNKWVGLNRQGKPFVVHVEHGGTRKYSPALVEAVARDLHVSVEEFREWWSKVVSTPFPCHVMDVPFGPLRRPAQGARPEGWPGGATLGLRGT